MGFRKYDDILTEAFLRKRYLEEGVSAFALGKELGINNVTIAQYLRRHNIIIRTKAEAVHTPVDYTGFLHVSDDWHAYWIGFLAADGCVFVKEEENHARVILSVKESDIDHVRNFQQGLKTTARILVASNEGGYNYKGKIAKITVSNPHFVSALAQWGIVPKKSLTLVWPSYFPSNLVSAYIRGFFDGNGTIYVRNRSRPGVEWSEFVCRFISGSVPFLEALQEELSKKGILTRAIARNQQSNAFVLSVSSRRENLHAFSDLLYHDATVWLARKRAIFQEMEVYHANHPRTGLNFYKFRPETG